MLFVAGATVIELQDQHCRVQRNARQGCICEKPAYLLHVFGGLGVSCLIQIERRELNMVLYVRTARGNKLVLL